MIYGKHKTLCVDIEKGKKWGGEKERTPNHTESRMIPSEKKKIGYFFSACKTT